jgi:hypothetical protein
MSGPLPQRRSAPRVAIGLRRARWLADVAAVLAVTLACLLFFWKAATLQGAFFHYDHAIQNYPYRLFFAQGLSRGHLPLWTNDMFCGFPLFAESQANALYPPFLVLFGLLKPWVAYNCYTVLHFLMAGLFTYLLARVMHVGRAGAVLAGVCYMLAGPVVSHAHHTNILVGLAWFPLLLALMELVLRRRTLLPLLGFAAATAALILGSQPQYTLYVGLVCGVFLLWRLRLIHLMGARARTLVGLPVAFSLAAALGVALAAVQLLPLMELVGHSTRAGAAMALPGVSPTVPGNLMTFLLPHYFGSPGLGSYWGDVDPGLYAELMLFVGAAPLMLALVGAITDRSRKTLFFAGLGLFAFLFSMGLSGSFYNVFAMLPVFRSARFPSRFAFATALSVAMLAGIGLERLLSAAGRERVRRAAAIACALVLLLATATICIAGAFNADLARLGRGELAAALPLADFELQSVWNHLHRTLPADIHRLALAATASTVLLLACARLGHRHRVRFAAVAAVLAVALVFGELAWAARDFNAVTSPAIYEKAPPLVDALRKLPPGRVFRYRYYDHETSPVRVGLYPFTPGWALRPALYAQSLARLPHNANLIWHIAGINGLSPLQTRALKALMGQPLAETSLIEYNLSPVLDLLNVRYVLTPRSKLPGDFRLLQEVGDIHVFENPHALPRAFIVHRAEVPLNDSGALATLRAPAPDYAGKVLIQDSATPLLSLSPGRADADETAQITAEDDDEVNVEARLSRPGYLVLADQHYPGWTVEVDGRRAELLRADFMLRAVRLEPGLHHVRFAFRPASFRTGTVVSLAALALLIGGTAFAVMRRGALPGVKGPERKRPLDGRCNPGVARLLGVSWAVFLALGPVLSPAPWRYARSQLDPRMFVTLNATSTAYYRAADGRFEDAYALMRDTCQWWPQNPLARAQLVKVSLGAVSKLLKEGRQQEAEVIAAEVISLAPSEAAKDAPAFAALARRAPPPAPTTP